MVTKNQSFKIHQLATYFIDKMEHDICFDLQHNKNVSITEVFYACCFSQELEKLMIDLLEWNKENTDAN